MSANTTEFFMLFFKLLLNRSGPESPGPDHCREPVAPHPQAPRGAAAAPADDDSLSAVLRSQREAQECVRSAEESLRTTPCPHTGREPPAVGEACGTPTVASGTASLDIVAVILRLIQEALQKNPPPASAASNPNAVPPSSDNTRRPFMTANNPEQPGNEFEHIKRTLSDEEADKLGAFLASLSKDSIDHLIEHIARVLDSFKTPGGGNDDGAAPPPKNAAVPDPAPNGGTTLLEFARLYLKRDLHSDEEKLLTQFERELPPGNCVDDIVERIRKFLETLLSSSAAPRNGAANAAGANPPPPDDAGQSLLNALNAAERLFDLGPGKLHPGTNATEQMLLQQIADRLANLVKTEVRECFDKRFGSLHRQLEVSLQSLNIRNEHDCGCGGKASEQTGDTSAGVTPADRK